MPFVPSPGVAEVRLQYLWDQQQVENVYHVFRGNGWDQNGLTQIADTFKNWWLNDLAAYVATEVQLQRVLATDISVQNGQSVESSSGLPLGGVLSSPALPNNVTVAVKWGTGLAGRSFRGRSYHVGLTEDGVTANQLNLARKNQLNGAYDALRTALDNVALGVEFCVLSKYANNAPRTAGICTPISGVAIDTTIDSQRRRLPGRGR
jgi:hypothetical protein